jgi:hypothetical protein
MVVGFNGADHVAFPAVAGHMTRPRNRGRESDKGENQQGKSAFHGSSFRLWSSQ